MISPKELSENVKKKRQNHTDDDQGRKREIEGKVLFFIDDIAGKFSQRERKLVAKREQHAYQYDHNAHDNNAFSYLFHWLYLLAALYETSRQSQPIRRIFLLYQDNTFENFFAVIEHNNTVNGNIRCLNTHPCSSAPTIYLAIGLASSLSSGMGLAVFSQIP